jgi:hypothetical protein
LLSGAEEVSGLVEVVLVDGLDLVSEGRGRDLGGREEGLEAEDLEEEGLDEEEDEEGLEDGPKDVDGTSLVLRSENSGIWSNEGWRCHPKPITILKKHQNLYTKKRKRKSTFRIRPNPKLVLLQSDFQPRLIRARHNKVV